MVLIDPRDEGRTDYEPFWGCSEYSTIKCRGTRQVDEGTGLPELTPLEQEKKLLEWIFTEYYPDPGADI
jgi:hypothetical protein